MTRSGSVYTPSIDYGGTAESRRFVPFQGAAGQHYERRLLRAYMHMASISLKKRRVRESHHSFQLIDLGFRLFGQ